MGTAAIVLLVAAAGLYVRWTMDSIVTLKAEVRMLRERLGMPAATDEQITGEDI